MPTRRSTSRSPSSPFRNRVDSRIGGAVLHRFRYQSVRSSFVPRSFSWYKDKSRRIFRVEFRPFAVRFRRGWPACFLCIIFPSSCGVRAGRRTLDNALPFAIASEPASSPAAQARPPKAHRKTSDPLSLHRKALRRRPVAFAPSHRPFCVTKRIRGSDLYQRFVVFLRSARSPRPAAAVPA